MPRTNTNKTVDSPKPTTVYNQAFLDELELRGVLEQQFLEQQSAPRVPKNYNDIHSAIQRERTHSPEPTALDYKEYVQAVFESRNEDEVQMTIFPLFFGLPVNIRNGHIKATNRTWTKRVAIMGNLSSDDYKQRPRPDYAEGLKVPSLPAWICKRLGAFAVPSEIMAFPNFTVELKRDLSMYTAHAQNRHNGSIASQAYHEYHVQILDKPDESWDIAKVGSIEFNGDIVVGNVHWVSKSDGDGTEGDHREYHMTRILCRFTYGLGYEDFKTARREARNFRDYFLNIRDNLREECKSLLDTTAAQIQGGTQSNPSASRIADEGPHLGNFDTEEADSEHAESQRANLEQDSNNRNSRKRGKSPMGKNPKIPSGGKPKKRKSGNAERVSKKNDTGLSFGTAQLGV